MMTNKHFFIEILTQHIQKYNKYLYARHNPIYTIATNTINDIRNIDIKGIYFTLYLTPTDINAIRIIGGDNLIEQIKFIQPTVYSTHIQYRIQRFFDTTNIQQLRQWGQFRNFVSAIAEILEFELANKPINNKKVSALKILAEGMKYPFEFAKAIYDLYNSGYDYYGEVIF